MNDVVARSKETYNQRFRTDMERWLPSAEWRLQDRIALACRMLHRDGHDSALAGQISARGEKPGT